jgi:tRNA dimethylallyltransferase
MVYTCDSKSHAARLEGSSPSSSTLIAKKHLYIQKKPKVIAVLGPTASGKTALGIFLAKAFSGEVISADSRQVYQGLDIGTAKVTKEEMSGVPHHLIDIIAPTKQYDAYQFQTDATKSVTEIHTRGNVPIIVGGTFFYVDLLRGRQGTAAAPADPALRARLEEKTPPELVAMLDALDPNVLTTIDQQNPRRLIRAIEVISTLGTRPSAQKAPASYDWLVIGLKVDKETLRTRYRARAMAWLSQGFLAEIENLLESGITPARLQEIGFEYTLGLDLLERRISETEFIDRFEQKNWQYAKRQQTWLKRDEEIKWFIPEETKQIKEAVAQFLHN